MATFKLDTSGHIDIWDDAKEKNKPWFWDDLSPFVQGYVEAMFADIQGDAWSLADVGITPHGTPQAQLDKAALRRCAFSDLAPETLARIMEDCERFCASKAALEWVPQGDPRHHECGGRAFWNARADRHVLQGHSYFAGMTTGDNLRALDRLARDFPPLPLYLGDDGKVRFQEQKAA